MKRKLKRKFNYLNFACFIKKPYLVLFFVHPFLAAKFPRISM